MLNQVTAVRSRLGERAPMTAVSQARRFSASRAICVELASPTDWAHAGISLPSEWRRCMACTTPL